MRAVVYEEFGGPIAIASVPDPVAPPAGVVVQVAATGLCRSDWHGWQGHDSDITRMPHVPGHEFAGVVVAVDPAVTRWRIGDRVTTPFVLGCGRCLTCEAGHHQVCPQQWQPGFHGWGSFAEFVALPFADTNLIAIPRSMSDGVAASLGCRTATAYRAVVHIAKVSPGEQVAVYGCGGVGLAAVMIARSRGARVIAIDPSQQARQLARDAGAAVVLSPAAHTVDEVITVTDGGSDVSIDAIGSPRVARDAIMGLRRRGRHVQAGLLPDGAHIPMDRVIAWELAVLGTHGLAAHDYPELLADVESGRLRPDLLITRSLSLAEVPGALAAMDSADHVGGVTIIYPAAANPPSSR